MTAPHPRTLVIAIVAVLAAATAWVIYDAPSTSGPGGSGDSHRGTATAGPGAEMIGAPDSPPPAPASDTAPAASGTGDPAPTAAAATEPGPPSGPGGAEVAVAGGLPIAVAGSLSWHPSVDRRAFRMVYQRHGEPTRRPIALTDDGEFRIFRTNPGMIDVTVLVHGEKAPLRQITDVVIPAAGTSRDPRLQQIDVREVQQMSLTVVDSAGEQIKQPLQYLAVPAGQDTGRYRNRRVADGVVRLLGRHSEYNVAIWSQDYARQRLIVRGDQRVELRRAGRVTVRLAVEGWDQKLPLPVALLRLPQRGHPRPLLTKQPAGFEQLPAVTIVGDNRDQVRGVSERIYHLGAPGNYWVGWQARHVGPGKGAPIWRPGEGTLTTFGDISADRTIEIAITAEELARMARPSRNKPSSKNAKGR